MKHRLYKIVIPLDEIQPPAPVLGVSVLEISEESKEAQEWDDFQLERQVRSYFVNHFTKEFERLYPQMRENAIRHDLGEFGIHRQWPPEIETSHEEQQD